jgi:hypothetical protein
MQVEVLSLKSDETGHKMRLAFSRDGEKVEKTVRLSGNRQENGYSLAIKAREADRDIAYNLHGGAWREHCEHKTPFWDGLTVQEFDSILAQLT